MQTRNNTFTSIQSSNAVSKSKAEKKLELALFKAATSENLRQLETAQNFPEKQTLVITFYESVYGLIFK